MNEEIRKLLQEISKAAVHKPSLVLGSIRAHALGEGLDAALPASEILGSIHNDPQVRNICWVGIDQGALLYVWLRPVITKMVEAWPAAAKELGTTPDDQDAKKEFYQAHGMGEIGFFGAWRMWRSEKPEVAAKTLANARPFFTEEFRGVSILEGFLAEPEKYPPVGENKVHILHTHGQQNDVCTGTDLDDKFPYDGLAPVDDWL